MIKCKCHNSEDPKSLLFPESRVLHNLYIRLWNLTQEREDIFFETHAWLENPELTPEITFSPREKQNEIEIEEVQKAIRLEEDLYEKAHQKPEFSPVQAILPIDR